jgi:hypothetical protein
MQAAISRSGYLFEQRLVPVIEKWGFKATANHRFQDRTLGTLQELDIHAITAKEISKRPQRFYFPILLVECKNLRCPLVFFTQPELRMRYFLGEPHFSGVPLEVFRAKGRTDLTEFLKLEESHHYYTRARISSQFCAVYPRKGSATGKPAKVSADDFAVGHKIGDIDLYHDGVLKLARALAAERRDHAETFRDDYRTKGIHLQLYYPVFVTGGPLYECYLGGKRPRYRRVHRLGFVFRTFRAGKPVDERLDVTDVQGFKGLLKVVDRETDQIAELLRRRRVVLEQASDRISRKFSRMSVEKRLSAIAGETEII